MTTSKPLTIRLHESDNVAVARMDLSAGTEIPEETIDGDTTVEEMGERIFNFVLEVASGKNTKSELNGIGDNEFVPWAVGATM